MSIRHCIILLALTATLASGRAAAIADSPATFPPGLRFEPQPSARFEFHGFVGERVQANIDNWLLRAPAANPGMLEMFRVRDREPAPSLVPWAGEFAGKYLISAIQALRMSDNPELRRTVSDVIAQLISTQADDGYLGPFRKHERLRWHWDLWGHYHCLLALLMWHEATADEAALNCARRAADLVCNTYLDTGRRALDAGSDEMNLAIIHSLGWLYRVTKEPRYLRMMREIEKDWERAGDYLRSGLAGVEFFQSPRPRWESLHDLQGLVELYRITGDTKYRDAFEHHWRSIARWDLRNTGGFSSGERATGNPYAPTAIETCCSIAWMAISVDMLALTGDPRVADLLELATFNAWAGAQHPSGRWCTYNTPMDGVREASAHTIVFQSRHGTPELNCCSVNGPRGWGMLSEWAVMRAPYGLALNWLAPATFTAELNEGSSVKLRVEGDYPVGSNVTIFVEPDRSREFTLSMRVPGWTVGHSVQLNDVVQKLPPAGSYLALKRVWRKGDQVSLRLDMSLRAVSGDKEARGKVSVYRGPLLFAYDQCWNAFDEQQIPPVDLSRLADARVTVSATTDSPRGRQFAPLLLMEVPTQSNATLRLCDFAGAGSTGTRYRSWLPAKDAPPPAIVTRTPRDGASIARGKVAFRWRGGETASDVTNELRISVVENIAEPIVSLPLSRERQTLVEIDHRFEPGRWYFWEVFSRNAAGATRGVMPSARFRVDTTRPITNEALETARPLGPGGALLQANLNGNPAPQFGEWQRTTSWQSATNRHGTAKAAVLLNGKQRLTYLVGEWPEEDYSVVLWCRIDQLPEGRIGQIFSAWAVGMDDPLRLTVDRGKLFARIEAGSGYSTDGVSIVTGKWIHVAAVKEGGRLRLFIDGKERTSTEAPEWITTTAKDFALGGNPHYSGNEFLAVTVSDLAFFPRAVSNEEIAAMLR